MGIDNAEIKALYGCVTIKFSDYTLNENGGPDTLYEIYVGVIT